MGKKEWLYKSTGAGGKSTSTAVKTKVAAGKSRGRERNVVSTPSSSSSSSSSGCMSAIFHFFDVQHHHHHPFQFQQASFVSDHSNITNSQASSIVLKGGEAPRNSLESEETTIEVDSSSPKIKRAPNLNIPMGGIQINTKRSRLMDDLSSECSSSPSTKTPNLVARLMGLDLLPENSSPRPSSSSPRPSSSSNHSTPLNPLSKLSSHSHSHSRSLPATPRVSTASRRSTDIDYHHRLSLKENYNCTRQQELSTSQYAKQIVKQVRENISRRRVGADITNTTGRKQEQRRDENLVLLKPRTPPPAATGKQDDSPQLSCSPRLRLLEIKNNLNKPVSNSPRSSPLSSSKPKTQAQEVQVMKVEKVVKNCKRIGSERYDLRLKKMQLGLNRQEGEEGGFVKKSKNKKKWTPLSNDLVDVSTKTTKFLSFKKDVTSPSTAARLTQRKVSLESITRLPSCQRRSYNSKAMLAVQDNNHSNGVATTTTTTTGGSVVDYFEYISDILKHSGIDQNTVISIAHWYSPSHPLHPSIFQKLSHHNAATNGTTLANQKLVFELVDELLSGILKPYLNLRPWAKGGVGSISIGRICGSELMGKLWESIGSFPGADCKVLEDIDALIEGDLRRRRSSAFEEEAEELVAEMEGDMVERLVEEIAASMRCHVRTSHTVCWTKG